MATIDTESRSQLLLKKSAAILLFFFLPLILFWSVTVGNRTLLPVDNLFVYQPFRSEAEKFGIEHSHNPLLSDLILQNYPWRRHIERSVKDGELPLWNPYLFSGTPFLAKGQHLALYPMSVVFFLFPLWKAYGVYTVLHLGLAGCFTYVLGRTMRLRVLEAVIAGICFQLSGFMLVRCVFPMIVGAAAWAPLILAATLKITSERDKVRHWRLIWVLIGALALGMQGLIGHIEIFYYTLLTAVFFALWRLAFAKKIGLPAKVYRGFAFILMLITGLMLGGAQLAPQYEVLQDSFRAEAASLSEVQGWAYPLRQVIVFFVPNFFGNPTHYEYKNFLSGEVIEQNEPVFWGSKNFVEGGVYPGILPLLLVLIALVRQLPFEKQKEKQRCTESPAIFLFLLLFALAFAFGAPLYALIYFLPGMEQVHSPFRWMLFGTLALAMLAGYGFRVVAGDAAEFAGRNKRIPLRAIFIFNPKGSLTVKIAWFAFGFGILVMGASLLGLLLFRSLEPFVAMMLRLAPGVKQAFPDAESFYSYQLPLFLTFGLLAILSGFVLALSHFSSRILHIAGGAQLWKISIVLLIVCDLFLFAWDFYPENEPALLDVRPPVVNFLAQDKTPWRFTTFAPNDRKTFPANVGWLYHFEDIRGYDSIFSADYAAYLSLVGRQDQLLFNRVSPIRQPDSLLSPLLDVLNVKYVITEEFIQSPKWNPVYEDQGVRVYHNRQAAPRAFILQLDSTVISEDPFESMEQYDPRFYVILDAAQIAGGLRRNNPPAPGRIQEVQITGYKENRVTLEVNVMNRSWLVLADSYDNGWQAFRRDLANGQGQRKVLHIYQVNGIFRGVIVEPGYCRIDFEYHPGSLYNGIFLTVLGGLILLALAAVALLGRRKNKAEASLPTAITQE